MFLIYRDNGQWAVRGLSTNLRLPLILPSIILLLSAVPLPKLQSHSVFRGLGFASIVLSILITQSRCHGDAVVARVLMQQNRRNPRWKRPIIQQQVNLY